MRRSKVRGAESYPKYFALNNFIGKVQPLFRSWLRNEKHMDYLRSVIIKMAESFQVMERTHDQETSRREILWELTPSACQMLSLHYLFEHLPAPEIQAPEPRIFWEHFLPAPAGSHDQIEPEMHQLLDTLSSLHNPKLKHQQQYIADLQNSFESFRTKTDRSPSAGFHPGTLVSRESLKANLMAHLQDCRQAIEDMKAKIVAALRQMPGSGGHDIDWYPLWPRITPAVLLEQLSRRRWKKLDELARKWKWVRDWQYCLVEYAKSWTVLQRAERLVRLANKGDNNTKDLTREIGNVGHENWNPMEFPESLLFEVENGILIRPIQQTIAEHMRAPSDGNAVMQLNMGEGKSSVIVPIVAAALAEDPRLVRVIVTKPQFKQMMHKLSTRLGGLLDRQVYTLPFSRQVGLTESRGKQIKAMCQECGNNGGVLLVQLDHVLSLKLLGLEAVISGKEALGKMITNAEFAFERHVRDIVDESDDIFNAKFELTYTMGSQNALQFSPQRWRLSQAALEAVADVLPDIKREFPDSLGVEAGRDGSFPRLRILRTSATPRLLSAAVRKVFLRGHEGLPTISLQPKAYQDAILRFITELHPAPEDISLAKEIFSTESERQPLLVLRGLMAYGILEFNLHGKRWRVNYGRDYNREDPTGLAVPYHAKDSPAPRAEFSHLEVVIVLTCLSYYYQGLSDDELFDVFDHLRASDQGETEYEHWTLLDKNIPTSLFGVNIKDRTHCKEQIFSRLRHFKAVIDYYLSNILFPRKMREFTTKLSASGWDLAGKRKHPITGFSGTNDSKHLLPWSVQQRDLPDQQHTNASVLKCIFRRENDARTIGRDSQGSRSTTDFLIENVVNSEQMIQVILDVGAQFIEHSNLEVARIWLVKAPSSTAEAAITFNDNDELIVLTRGGPPELLASSPYWNNAASCLVFLDEAHTRGTDLPLPDDYRAAVMLGPNLTKDKLVQG